MDIFVLLIFTDWHFRSVRCFQNMMSRHNCLKLVRSFSMEWVGVANLLWRRLSACIQTSHLRTLREWQERRACQALVGICLNW